MAETRLLLGDCLDLLPELEGGSIDVIIIDPPYSTPIVTAFGREQVKNFGDLSLQAGYFKMLKLQFERVLKPDGRVFIFCDDKYYPILFVAFYNWQNLNLVIWDKGKIGMGNPFRKQHELILYANRSSYEYHRTDQITHYPSILKYAPVDKKLHGAQKPVKLLKDLILGFSNEGDTVLDCFMGSGSTGVACQETKRNFIGMEITQEYYEMAEFRLQSLTQPNNRLQPTAFGVGTQAEFPLLGSSQADESPAKNGGG